MYIHRNVPEYLFYIIFEIGDRISFLKVIVIILFILERKKEKKKKLTE